MDYRHPIKQIANKYLAVYRDTFPSLNLAGLETAVNMALQAIWEAGHIVHPDNNNTDRVVSVSLGQDEYGRLTMGMVCEACE